MKQLRSHYIKQLLLNLIALFSISGMGAEDIFSPVSAGQNSDAIQLMMKLRQAIAVKDAARAMEISDELGKLGSSAVATVRDALRESDGNMQTYLIRALSGIEGDAATQLLVEIMAQASTTEARLQALSTLHNRPIDFVLNDGQIESLVRIVRDESIGSAGSAARILSRCESNDKAEMMQAILERFIQEVANPSKLLPIHGSYVSPRVYVLNQFLLAFADLRCDAIYVVKSSLEKAQTPEMRKWLTLALGMTGESSIAPGIRDLIENDKDVYFRCVAVRAYARSAADASVPFLKTLLADDGESEYDTRPDGTPVYPVRFAAQGELSRLGYPAKPAEVRTTP